MNKKTFLCISLGIKIQRLTNRTLAYLSPFGPDYGFNKLFNELFYTWEERGAFYGGKSVHDSYSC